MIGPAGPAYLQTYICPVCTYSDGGSGVDIRDLVGTAFLISGSGIFMTAKHVLTSAKAIAEEKGRRVGVVVKGPVNDPVSFIAPVLEDEAAPEPYDACLLQTDYLNRRTFLTFGGPPVEVWQDVATCGYPINALTGPPEALFLNLRAHRGYVQRILKPDDLPFGPHPAGFELSFLLSRGLSGAPLFVKGKFKDIAIGICTSSMRSETIENQRTEVLEGGETYRELQLRIDEFGVAQDLRPLSGWKPRLLNGLSLMQASPM